VAGRVSDHQPFEAVFALARAASNGDTFDRLWRGDASGYDSESEADLALCNLVAFWVGPDPAQVEAMFSESEPGKRPKWRERRDYRERTIAKALEGRTEFYQQGHPRAPASSTRGTRSNQKIQSKQEGTGQATRPACRRSDQCLFPAQAEAAKRLALELARSDGHLPNFQLTFKLARRLRTLGVDERKLFTETVAVFCEATNREFEEFWYDFLDCWPKVRLAEGDDVFAWAARCAKERPYTPTPCLGLRYAAVASIAWHLSQYAGQKPFWLPRERLAELLGISASQVSKIVKLLVAEGVVRCVSDAYSYTEHKAKEYAFTGPPPPPNPEVVSV
jgi:hypothetical protein